MKFKKITKEDIKTSLWAGGETNQVLIYPFESEYKERNFLFRLSFATCLVDSSDFTSLPDYERHLSVIKGGVELDLLDRNEKKSIAPYEIFKFDGSERIKSRGSCTDFNLMTRKGKCDGNLESFTISGEKSISLEEFEAACIFITEGEAECFGEKAGEMEGFFIDGEGDISFKGNAKGFLAVTYTPSI